MAGFYNPFSAKPDYGSGIQELLGQLAQMIMIKKMGQNGGQQQLPPPTQPQQRSQGPMNQAVQQAPGAMPQGPPPGSPQQFMSPMGGGQPPMGGQVQGPSQRGGISPEAKIAQALPPELQSIFFEILKLAKFPTQGQSGQRPAGR